MDCLLFKIVLFYILMEDQVEHLFWDRWHMQVQNHISHKKSYFQGWNKIHIHHPLVLTLESILQKTVCNANKNTLSR